MRAKQIFDKFLIKYYFLPDDPPLMLIAAEPAPRFSLSRADSSSNLQPSSFAIWNSRLKTDKSRFYLFFVRFSSKDEKLSFNKRVSRVFCKIISRCVDICWNLPRSVFFHQVASRHTSLRTSRNHQNGVGLTKYLKIKIQYFFYFTVLIGAISVELALKTVLSEYASLFYLQRL